MWNNLIVSSDSSSDEDEGLIPRKELLKKMKSCNFPIKDLPIGMKSKDSPSEDDTETIFDSIKESCNNSEVFHQSQNSGTYAAVCEYPEKEEKQINYNSNSVEKVETELLTWKNIKREGVDLSKLIINKHKKLKLKEASSTLGLSLLFTQQVKEEEDLVSNHFENNDTSCDDDEDGNGCADDHIIQPPRVGIAFENTDYLCDADRNITDDDNHDGDEDITTKEQNGATDDYIIQSPRVCIAFANTDSLCDADRNITDDDDHDGDEDRTTSKEQNGGTDDNIMQSPRSTNCVNDVADTCNVDGEDECQALTDDNRNNIHPTSQQNNVFHHNASNFAVEEINGDGEASSPPHCHLVSANIKLNNVKHKYASKKLQIAFSNEIESHCRQDQCFRERYIDNLFVVIEHSLPTEKIIMHLVEFFKLSESILNISKLRSSWLKLSVQGLISYQNFPLSNEELFLDIIDTVCTPLISDKRKWFNYYSLLDCIVELLNIDLNRYKNNLRLSLGRRVLCPKSSFYTSFEKYFERLKHVMLLWSNQNTFLLEDSHTEESIVIQYREVFVTIQKLLLIYLKACPESTIIPDVAYVYSNYHVKLISTQKRLLVSTITDIELKLYVLDLIIQNQFISTVEMKISEMSLVRLIREDFERLPPRFPYTKLSDSHSIMYSLEEIDEFVYILLTFAELYLCHIKLCGKELSVEEKALLIEIKPRVERLSLELLSIVDDGMLSLSVRLKLCKLSNIGSSCSEF